MKPWIGVDLDGTLAEYNGWQGAARIGAPVPEMVDLLKMWLAEGKDVRIFTARISPPDPLLPPEEFARRSLEVGIAAYEIKKWCYLNLGKVLPITYQKDYGMVECWDDRCVQVEPNTGIRSVEVAFKAGYQKGLADGYSEHGPQEEHGITN